MKSHSVILYVFFVLVFSVATCGAVKVVDQRYPYEHNGKTYKLPYKSNYAIDAKNSDIRHVIIAIHGASCNAASTYRNCNRLISKSERSQLSTLIITPQFLKEEFIDRIDPDVLFWTVNPFWGSSKSTVRSSGKDLRVSAYDILEDMIASLCPKENFPNLRRITVMGHSGGGQFVNRFAASNRVEDSHVIPAGLKMQYIVMNPSSYVYLTPKRSVNGSRREFAIPDTKTVTECSEYNDYGYGLNKLYAYHRRNRISAQEIIEKYSNRNVIYMLGLKDTVADSMMSIKPGAMLQGKNRLDRGKIYYGHLLDKFGLAIKEKHKFVTVPGVGHSFRGMVLSKKAEQIILGR